MKTNKYSLPKLSLLQERPAEEGRNNPDQVKQALLSTVKEKGYEISIQGIKEGPAFTSFYCKLEGHTRYVDIKGLEEDIAMKDKPPNGTVVISGPIPHRETFGIDIPNIKRHKVTLKRVLEKANLEKDPFLLNIPLGVTTDGNIETINISKQPHILISGAVLGGKSSFFNVIINTLLFRTRPEEVKMILVDTKRIEFSWYGDLPNLLCPVIRDPKEAVKVFPWLVGEMSRRYHLLEKVRVSGIEDYNKISPGKKLPYIILMIDEFSDIMITDPVIVENSIVELAELSRIVGIHMILCTQRPSTQVFTERVRDEIQSRICFSTASNIDSRVVLDQEGAEKLLGSGDLFYKDRDSAKIIRAQAPYISYPEIDSVTEYIKKQEKPKYDKYLSKLIEEI